MANSNIILAPPQPFSVAPLAPPAFEHSEPWCDRKSAGFFHATSQSGPDRLCDKQHAEQPVRGIARQSRIAIFQSKRRPPIFG